MGWSCSAAASDTLRRLTNACVSATGSANAYPFGGNLYIIETSRREHTDGAITGTLYRQVNADGTPNTDPRAEHVYCRRAGSFRIDGDGTIARAPAWMRAAAARAPWNGVSP